MLGGNHEAVFWISSTGFLFTSLFTLLSLLSYIFFKEKGNNFYLGLTIVFIILSFLFHEVGVVTPLIIIAYDLIFGENFRKIFKKVYLVLLVPLVPYLILRVVSQSHWLSGDYNYNIFKLPFNVVGNSIGYFALDLFGPQSLRFYESMRNILKDNLILAAFVSLAAAFVAIFLIRNLVNRLNSEEKRVVVFGVLFFLLALLPFLGLGNITSRYAYLSSIGFVIVFALLIGKLFAYLRTLSDKYTFSMIVILTTMVFLSFQLFQLQNLHTEWKVAGERVQKFLTSFEDVFLLNQYGTYDQYDTRKPMAFYFVDVPIRFGEAWIFPVGLKDALWFALENKNFTVDTFGSVGDALFRQESNPKAGVFVFEKDGTVRKVFKINNNIMILPKKE